MDFAWGGLLEKVKIYYQRITKSNNSQRIPQIS